jgi:hypothetical protein
MPFVISDTKPKSNSSWNFWPLKMGQSGCPETSVNSYQYTLCNIPRERRPIFQSSLPVQSTHSNVYNVIHAQIYPSEFCHLVVLLNASFRLNSYLTENREAVETKCDSFTPTAVSCPRYDAFPVVRPLSVNQFWLCLARQTPWSSLNYCQNFKLVFIFPGELRVPPAEKHSDTFFCIQIYTYYVVRCNWRLHLSPTGGSSGVFLLPNWISYLIYMSSSGSGSGLWELDGVGSG